MKTHTTKGGDKFLQNHILDATPWSDEAYKKPTNPLPAESVASALAGLITVAGLVAAIIVIHYQFK